MVRLLRQLAPEKRENSSSDDWRACVHPFVGYEGVYEQDSDSGATTVRSLQNTKKIRPQSGVQKEGGFCRKRL